jgi:hypothetical protein
LFELEAIGRQSFVQGELHDLQLKAVVIVGAFNADLARERGARRWGRRTALVVDYRLPIPNMNVGEQNALGTKRLQAGDL